MKIKQSIEARRKGRTKIARTQIFQESKMFTAGSAMRWVGVEISETGG